VPTTSRPRIGHLNNPQPERGLRPRAPGPPSKSRWSSRPATTGRTPNLTRRQGASLATLDRLRRPPATGRDPASGPTPPDREDHQIHNGPNKDTAVDQANPPTDAAGGPEITSLCKDTWVRQVLSWELAGDTPSTLRLSWSIDAKARTALEAELFGKRVLVTNRDSWPISDVVAAYRCQSDAEFGFRQLKDPQAVSFSPMHHWTDQSIRVHVYTCVLALQIADVMRRDATHAGLNLSVRELLTQLAGIQETVLIYPSTGGRPKTRHQLTETSPQQQKLIEIFDLTRWAPRT